MDDQVLFTALAAAREAGATYAEARGQAGRERVIAARDGAVETVSQTTDAGWGVQVAVDAPSQGGWGFAATSQWDAASAAATAREAVAIARASAGLRRSPVSLEGLPAESGDYRTTVQRDPFAVPDEESIALVVAATDAMRAAGPRVVAARASLHAWQTTKRFVNTLGADLSQTIVEVEIALSAVAQDDSGYTYRRSFVTMHQAGWEFVEDAHLLDHARRVGDEASILVAAPWAPTGPQPVVIGADFVALIIHESCGHPTELDRVLGWETAFAGASFLLPEMRGNFRYGSDQVTLSADATTPGGLGTFGWDDEGTPAQRWDLVRDGIFVDYLTSRASAPALGERSRGCGRASGWARMPIVRMVNVSLAPRHGDLDALLGNIERGLYLETPSSWSLDDKRMNFHFSAEAGREIVNGRLGGYVKGAAIQARTPEFWGAVAAVGGPEAWQLRGFSSCAKGEPLQLAHVAHGAAPIRLNELAISRG